MSRITDIDKYKVAILMREEGLTLQEIGDRFKVSRERIRQVLNKICGEKYINKVEKPKNIKKCLFCDKDMFLTNSQMSRQFCSKLCLKKGRPRIIRTPEEQTLYNTERAKRYRNTKKGKFIVRKIAKQQYKKYKKKANARSLLNWHVNNGSILKPDACSICNKTGYIHAHHEDYSKPLDVIWVCPKCHKDIHSGLLTLPV